MTNPTLYACNTAYLSLTRICMFLPGVKKKHQTESARSETQAAAIDSTAIDIGAKLQDWEKAVVFLGLCEIGLPSGTDQWQALALLTGWPKARCVSALHQACERGMAEWPPQN